MTHGINLALRVTLRAMIATSTVGACALTSKAELVEIRYFAPEPIQTHNRTAKSTLPRLPELRLGRVSSGSYLRDRIAYRDSAYELGYYNELRWTERPETYVRRQLGRSLFEARDLRRVVSGRAATLDVEVLAFDDVRLAKGRAARIRLNILLYSDEGVLFEDTFTTDCFVAAQTETIEDLVAAMATALEAASAEVTQKVLKALELARDPSRPASTQ